MTTLFDPLRCGDIGVANRVAMAPLTRNRAGPGQVPTPLMKTYCAQRATAGLIISEATQISAEGQGYLDTPGIHSAAQIDFPALRTRFRKDGHRGAWIVNNGYTRAMAMTAVESGDADMVAFGRPFIGNPDLVERLRENAPLAKLVPETLYGGSAAGYTDYPALEREPVTI